jgi:hypothetical protein
MKFVKVFALILATIALVLSRKIKHKKHRKIGGKKLFNEPCTPNLIESLADFINDDCADGLKCLNEGGKPVCKKIGGQECFNDIDCYDKKCTSLPLIRMYTCDTKLFMGLQKCAGVACYALESISNLKHK